MNKIVAVCLALALAFSCLCYARDEKTVTDAAGREVKLPETAARIVSGYYITTSLIVALGVKERLVGIEMKADTRPINALAAPELLALPNVGSAKNFSLEGCIALKPDIAILPKKLSAAADELASFGITAVVVNPESLDELYETIRVLGLCVGAQERADELLEYCKTLNEKAASFNGEPVRTYLAGNSSYLRTAGRKMYQNDLLTVTGAQNVAAELDGASWQDISYEQLIAWDPQTIIIASDADYGVDDIYADKALEGINAVKNGRVYKIPGDVEAWDSPVPGAPLGSLYIASVLYPEVYSHADFTSDVNAFYSHFYGVKPYEE